MKRQKYRRFKRHKELVRAACAGARKRWKEKREKWNRIIIKELEK